MSVPRVRFLYEGEQFYSPFSGLPVFLEDPETVNDPSVMFVHIGDAGLYSHWNHELLGPEPDDPPSVEDLIVGLEVANALVIELDQGWNGVNSIGFVPIPVPEAE